MNEAEYAKARDTAVTFLGRAPRSAKEVGAKLTEKGFSAAVAQSVVDMLASHGYIDDAAYAVALIRHRSDVSNYGKGRIVAELHRKGVAREHIIAAYNQVFGNNEAENSRAAARRALDKRLRGKDEAAMLADPKAKARLVGYLARRGFDFDVIKSVLTASEYED